MRADFNRGAVGISAGWSYGNVTQQTQTVTCTTDSLVQPWAGCALDMESALQRKEAEGKFKLQFGTHGHTIVSK